MAKIGAEKIWHQVFHITEKNLVQNPQIVAQQAQSVSGGSYFPWAFGWLLLFPGGLVSFVEASGWLQSLPLQSTLRGHKGNVHPKSSNNDTRKMATSLKIPWHNLAHFCCAKFCRSEVRIFEAARQRHDAPQDVCMWMASTIDNTRIPGTLPSLVLPSLSLCRVPSPSSHWHTPRFSLMDLFTRM